MALNNAHDTGSLSTAQETPSVSDARPSGSAYVLAGLAAAVVDSRGAVVRWTEAAADLTGFTAQEVCGRPVRELVAELPDGLRGTTQMPASGRVRLWLRCGNTVDVAFRTTRLSGSAECLAREVAEQVGGSLDVVRTAQDTRGPRARAGRAAHPDRGPGPAPLGRGPTR
ncbi:PAS domain S-box protein [Streptomyces sp. NPDC093261]|uniref:PAS domain S-box protein n=1 Tax=Streptomyces sp. NPDC093261 TaxID=3366037 RepID=UPI00381F71B7